MILERIFKYGRSMAFFEPQQNVPTLFGVPRHLFRKLIEEFVKKFITFRYSSLENLELQIKYWMLKGQIYQYYLLARDK